MDGEARSARIEAKVLADLDEGAKAVFIEALAI